MIKDNMILEKSVLRIYEGLTKQMIKENTSIEDIEDKINIIMDALGLEVKDKKEEIETKEEPKVEEETEEVIEDTEEEKEETPDTFTVEEGLESDNEGKYTLVINKDIIGYDGDKNKNFNNLDDIIKYIEKEIPLRTSYNSFMSIEEKDEEIDNGELYKNAWYTIIKN